MLTPVELRANLHEVQDNIEAAARLAGRDPAEITLVAVTKGHPPEAIRVLYELGVRDFGESRPEKGNERAMQLPDLTDVQWHLIGPVQSRKAALAARHFNFLHSLDRLKLAARLAEALPEGRRLPVLLQCNVSGETSKGGWLAMYPDAWPALLPEFEQVIATPGLDVRGLMTMAPYSEDAQAARPVFARLRELREFLRQNLPAAGWADLSMGMSGDYEAAILEGATLVRVGTALLGPAGGE